MGVYRDKRDLKERRSRPPHLAPPWPKGKSPNPGGGRKDGSPNQHIGALVMDWLRWMGTIHAKDSTDLKRIIKIMMGRQETCTSKHLALLRLYRALFPPDLTDFEPLMDGSMTLKELRDSGVDTSVIKKYRRRETKYGVSVDLEFHDWTGDEFDRIMDRDIGKPGQSIDIAGSIEHKHSDSTATEVIERLREIAKRASAPADIQSSGLALPSNGHQRSQERVEECRAADNDS